MNELLSICIPTYNRSETLKGCLESIIPQASKYYIPIYVSDNASEDDTKEIVAALQQTYEGIYYSRNEQNLGADHNIELVLKMSKSKYTWLFGDRGRLFEGAIESILPHLSGVDHDLMVVNSFQDYDVENKKYELREKDISYQFVYFDQNQLLEELGWHMTYVSSLILGADIIRSGNFKKYRWTEIAQIGIIFEYLSGKKISVLWMPRPVTYGVKAATGWGDRAFEIYITNWMNMINSLPSDYRESAKRACIKAHGIKANLFTLRGLLRLRAGGHFNYVLYKRYSSYFKYVTNVPRFIVFLISILPPIPSATIIMLHKIRDYFRPKWNE